MITEATSTVDQLCQILSTQKQCIH